MRERFNWKKAISIVTVTSLAVETVFGFIERPETQRAWEAYNSPTPNCGEFDPNLTYHDTLVVFGASQDANRATPQKSDLFEGTAAAYLMTHPSKIVIVGDIPGYKERAVFQEINKFIKDRSGNQETLEFKNIIFLKRSVTLAHGMQNLKNHMKSTNTNGAIGISNMYYANRIKLLQENYGIDMTNLQAECLLDNPMPQINTDFLIGEKILIVEAILDPQQRLVTEFALTIKNIKKNNQNK